MAHSHPSLGRSLAEASLTDYNLVSRTGTDHLDITPCTGANKDVMQSDASIAVPFLFLRSWASVQYARAKNSAVASTFCSAQIVQYPPATLIHCPESQDSRIRHPDVLILPTTLRLR